MRPGRKHNVYAMLSGNGDHVAQVTPGVDRWVLFQGFARGLLRIPDSPEPFGLESLEFLKNLNPHPPLTKGGYRSISPPASFCRGPRQGVQATKAASDDNDQRRGVEAMSTPTPHWRARSHAHFVS